MSDNADPSNASEACESAADAEAGPDVQIRSSSERVTDEAPPNSGSAAGLHSHSDAKPPEAESPPIPVDPLQALLSLALTADPFYSAHLERIARELLTQLAPQDAAETMLVTQMIGTFCRSMFLSRYANRQKNVKWFSLYSGECDRAMNLYRRQMQTLGDYRRPRRTIFNAIRTANIAGQQVVLNDSSEPAERPRRKAARAQSNPAEQTQTALPPVSDRQSRAPRRDSQNAAVEAQHRSPND